MNGRERTLKFMHGEKVDYMQTATFCGQQGRISRPVRAILNGQF